MKVKGSISIVQGKYNIKKHRYWLMKNFKVVKSGFVLEYCKVFEKQVVAKG